MLYTINEYDKRYRPYNKSGEELQNADWVKMPAKPKGDGLQTLLKYPRGLEVLAVWCLLLQKTTTQKPEKRGKLLNHKDEPATISEIAQSISLPKKEKMVEYAISVLVEMGWMLAEGKAETGRKLLPPSPTKSSVVKSSVVKEYSAEFLNFWKRFKGRWNEDKSRHDKGGKLEAFAEWRNLTKPQRAMALEVAPLTGDKITKDCCRWLKNHRWEDFEKSAPPPTVPKPKLPEKPVKILTVAEKKAIAAKIQKQQQTLKEK